MRPWFLCLPFLLLLALLSAAPAAAITLALDAGSELQPSTAATQPLSGLVEVQVGSAPTTDTTSFDVVDLAIGTDELDIGLDPGALSPGLGVSSPTGETLPDPDGTGVLTLADVLIGTLFLEVRSQGGSQAFAIVDVPGVAVFADDGGLRMLETDFEIDGGASLGLTRVVLSATVVPEPGSLALMMTWLASLFLIRRLRGKEIR